MFGSPDTSGLPLRAFANFARPISIDRAGSRLRQNQEARYSARPGHAGESDQPRQGWEPPVRRARKDRAMNGRTMRRLAAGALGLAATMGVGCATNQGEYDMLVDENNELRGQLAALEGERAMWMDTKSKLEQENMELAQALEDMRARGEVDASGNLPGVDGASSLDARVRMWSFRSRATCCSLRARASVQSGARSTLNRVAELLNGRFAENQVRIEGYTDTDPIRKSKWASNEHLSFERAHAVEKYLISRGVDTKRMYVGAFGPDRPRRAASPQSRRVEIVVLGN